MLGFDPVVPIPDDTVPTYDICPGVTGIFFGKLDGRLASTASGISTPMFRPERRRTSSVTFGTGGALPSLRNGPCFERPYGNSVISPSNIVRPSTTIL